MTSTRAASPRAAEPSATTPGTVWPDHLGADMDRTGPIPLYFQLAARLESAIRSGEIAPGARLENEIAIAHRLNLSRPTVRRAMQELVDMGLLVRRRGIGTQVVQGQVTRSVELTSLHEDLQRSGRTPTTEVLTHTQRRASDEIATLLGVPTGARVLHLRRRRFTDGTPVALLDNHLPESFADITSDDLTENGLYPLLRARGVGIRIAQQRIGARRATAEERTLLDLDRHDSVLTVERVAFDDAGRAVEVGRHCYRPDMYSFETTLVAR